ncbi:ABC transporter ATP-binding protein [Falsiroseomonas bella]|uniref:ABC transporter ATP-binding protein n=1 Tax=Falsiroseomonas bella TaxID=2184016 RepID=UPI0018EEBE6E|nr:ABC transporter ATP-binding protein [Falsiroseomonas bella]
MTAAFELRGLTAAVPGEKGAVRLVEEVSLHVRAGETLAVVGESGSGKTVTFTSALGLLPKPGRVIAGEALLEGEDLLKLSPEALRRRRGARIGMVFQDPLTGLNPVFRVGEQIAEVLRAHLPISRREARERAVALLARVQIPDPARRVDDYPHQFSGGMRQRVLIAMAIALGPRVLIADEPTTALDVTVQAQVLDLLGDLRDAEGMAMVLITHDLGVVARQADRVAVMYAGRVVETGTVAEVFAAPRHPYTISLFRSIPDVEAPAGTTLAPIAGSPPDPARRPVGCAFAPRCFAVSDAAGCRSARPLLIGAGHEAACHRQGAAELAA